MTIVQTYETNN